MLVSARRRAWEQLGTFAKPLVAAIAGYVLGGGCELALMCDMIVAGDSAMLGQPEIRLGIIPGAGGTQRWARVAGQQRAAEVVLTARMVTAWEAYRMGIVNKVVPSERVVAAATEMAESITSYSPLATRLAKAALRQAEEMPLAAALEHERTVMATLLSTDDHLEGIDAFLEKRRAEFAGS
jgi:enoyl-CoA hydratase/carnithine racemase